jgi:predicted alpha/beta superfamily hydrolase
MMRHFFKLLIAIFSAATFASGAVAEVTPLNHLPALKGDYFQLESKGGLGIYHAYIRYPENYEKDRTTTYPIVYLLDGDTLFPYLAPHHLFLTYDDQLPEAIVVGIAYGSFANPINRRERDFGEGAAAFHGFLKNEMMPAVERRTRADPKRRILAGQSLGGGFVLYSAHTDADLFWGRIASNPSFYAHKSLLAGKPVSAQRNDLKLAVASGTKDRPRSRGMALEWKEWHGTAKQPWAVRWFEIPEGTHAADMPNTYRQAMTWLLKQD